MVFIYKFNEFLVTIQNKIKPLKSASFTPKRGFLWICGFNIFDYSIQLST